jgi:hypothetical protein
MAIIAASTMQPTATALHDLPFAPTPSVPKPLTIPIKDATLANNPTGQTQTQFLAVIVESSKGNASPLMMPQRITLKNTSPVRL